MVAVEKSGMLVNAEKEVVGWVAAGSSVDMKEGDVVVSHFKTADKLGLREQFDVLKAENAPKKEAKASADGEKKERGPRMTVPREGSYEVLKTAAAELKEGEEAGERHEILTKLFANTDFAVFWEGTPEKFSHPGRDGELKSFATSGLVTYAIRRGMIAPK